jgi:hypothetical protein
VKYSYPILAGLVLLMACRETTTSTPAPPPSVAETAPRAAEPPQQPQSPACVPAERRLCPVDEGTRDASFVAFRNELLDAIAKNDEERLLQHVDPKIRMSFGTEGGTEAFKQRWRETELEKILRLGGTFREGDNFWAPYVYSAWPESIDVFEHLAAIRAGVPLRKTASADAETVTTVDWAILELIPEPNAPRDWFHLKTADGKEGWVHAADVHSPVGYRAGFSKRSGQWKLEALVAGD